MPSAQSLITLTYFSPIAKASIRRSSILRCDKVLQDKVNGSFTPGWVNRHPIRSRNRSCHPASIGLHTRRDAMHHIITPSLNYSHFNYWMARVALPFSVIK